MIAVQPQNVPDGVVDLLEPGDGRSGGRQQGGLGALLGGSRAVELGPLILGHPAHGVALAPAFKFQLHKGGCFRRGIFGAEHAGAALAAAGLAVQGEGDGVEQGGFSRPGVAGDEVQSAFPQLVQGQRHLPGVGAEGTEGKI